MKKNILDNLKELRIIESKQFSIYVSNDQNLENSTLQLGGFNKMYMKDDNFIFSDIIKQEKYNIRLDSILLDNTVDISLQVKSATLSIGTSLITLDRNSAENLLALLEEIF